MVALIINNCITIKVLIWFISGNDFPSSFDAHIRKIHRLLFHVLAHIYHSHFKEIVLLQLHAHLNAVFVHFVEFSLRFHLVEEKELEVSTDKTALVNRPPSWVDRSLTANLRELIGQLLTVETCWKELVFIFWPPFLKDEALNQLISDATRIT